MNIEQINQVAWVGDKVVKGPIRGVIVSLMGLGFGMLRSDAWPEEIEAGEAGYLTVLPYYGPWSWMNRQSRAFIDDWIESVYREYKISPDAPLVATGDSMGGLASLLLARYSRKPVTRCLALYPVCDLPFHYTERPDVPRTIRMAYWGYPEPWEDVLIEHSPLHQIGRMPRIPYQVMHGQIDGAVNIQKHSDRFVAEMKKQGHNVTYHSIAGYGHGGPMPPEMHRARMKFVLGQ